MGRETEPTWQHRVEYVAVKILSRVVVLLPTAVSINLAALLGAIVSRVFPIRRATILENLDIAFGDSMSAGEKRRLARECYKSLFMLAAETMYIQYGHEDWVTKAVTEVEGAEQLERLKQEGRKYVLITGHFGNWELAGAYVNRYDKFVALATPLHNPLMFEEVKAARERHGLEVIWAGIGNPMKNLLKAVREGTMPCVLIDQDARQHGVFVPFFGREASTMETAATIAVRNDIPVIPVFMVRLGPTRHRIIFRPAIDPRELGDLDRGDRGREILVRATKELEDMVRLYPAQYFWFHRRWKTTPEKVRKQREKEAQRRLERARAKEETEGSENTGIAPEGDGSHDRLS